MADPAAEQKPHVLDDPVQKARTVRLLMALSPAIFVMCTLLAWFLGAEARHGALIGLIGAGMGVAAAAAIHLLGSKAWMALVAVKIALALAGRR